MSNNISKQTDVLLQALEACEALLGNEGVDERRLRGPRQGGFGIGLNEDRFIPFNRPGARQNNQPFNLLGNPFANLFGGQFGQPGQQVQNPFGPFGQQGQQGQNPFGPLAMAGQFGQPGLFGQQNPQNGGAPRLQQQLANTPLQGMTGLLMQIVALLSGASNLFVRLGNNIAAMDLSSSGVAMAQSLVAKATISNQSTEALTSILGRFTALQGQAKEGIEYIKETIKDFFIKSISAFNDFLK